MNSGCGCVRLLSARATSPPAISSTRNAPFSRRWSDGLRTRGKWNGFEFGIEGEISDTRRYRKVSAAARELGAALDDFNLPAIFQGNDLIWKRLDGTEANWEAERDEDGGDTENFARRCALPSMRPSAPSRQ